MLFSYPSLARRGLIAKGTAVVIGGLAVLLGQRFFPDIGLSQLIGWWLWLVMLSGIIALVGLYDRLPLLGWRFPFWLRGPAIGLVLCLVYALIAPLDLARLMTLVPAWVPDWLRSPYAILFDGLFYGLLFDWLATRWGGEGPRVQECHRPG